MVLEAQSLDLNHGARREDSEIQYGIGTIFGFDLQSNNEHIERKYTIIIRFLRFELAIPNDSLTE